MINHSAELKNETARCLMKLSKHKTNVPRGWKMTNIPPGCNDFLERSRGRAINPYRLRRRCSLCVRDDVTDVEHQKVQLRSSYKIVIWYF